MSDLYIESGTLAVYTYIVKCVLASFREFLFFKIIVERDTIGHK